VYFFAVGDVMKKRLLMGAAIGALTGVSPALAADLPVKAPVAPVVAPYSWTGCYVGGNAGYSWGRARGNVYAPDIGAFGLPTSFPVSFNPDGFIGGGQIGCNWQLNTSWVVGLEADFQGSAEKHGRTLSDPFTFIDGEGIGTGVLTQSLEAKIKWFGTVRGRAGFLVTPTIMVYGTGGLAYGRTSLTDTISISAPVPSTVTFSSSKTRVGWTAGAGVEGALFNSNNWTWKVEYLYIDLGSQHGSGVDPVIGNYSWDVKFTDHIARVGFNYKFR
jgi:outer membrane immunogenic protein